jgi:hypothetical protein
VLQFKGIKMAVVGHLVVPSLLIPGKQPLYAVGFPHRRHDLAGCRLPAR